MSPPFGPFVRSSELLYKHNEIWLNFVIQNAHQRLIFHLIFKVLWPVSKLALKEEKTEMEVDCADSGLLESFRFISWMFPVFKVTAEVGKLLGEEKVDAILCVAGGWAGGNAKSKCESFPELIIHLGLIVALVPGQLLLCVFQNIHSQRSHSSHEEEMAHAGGRSILSSQQWESEVSIVSAPASQGSLPFRSCRVCVSGRAHLRVEQSQHRTFTEGDSIFNSSV